ncbi:MAG TPA: efflux RND transporter periplasmic adaptor subunit, partial [Candidatus Binatia bacterium]|nr:efflux RND transporter periplasmic adaptor subunit [Candidatus Binatia bacterium]
MNSDESKHNEVPETPQDGKHSVASESPASPETNRLLPYSTRSSAPTGPTAETNNKPAAKSPSERGRIIGAIIALVIVAGLVLGFLPRWRQSRSTATDTSQLAIPSVSVVSPTPGTNRAGLLLPAEVRPWLEASIFARANGYLKNWVADIGAHVEAGQLLGTIETPDLDQQLAQAQAELVLAQANLHLAQVTDDRWKELLKTASVSEQAAAEKAAARETAAASVEAMRANMRRLQELVSFQNIVAPFPGTVTIRAVDVGDLIVAGSDGKELFHLAQADKLRVYVRVPQTSALGIAPGQAASLAIPELPDQPFPAKVVTTSESISTTSRTLLVQLQVDNSQHRILPYSYGEVRFAEGAANSGLTLPSNTLLFHAEGLQVAVVNSNSVVELRKVQVGRDFGQTVEITG